MTTNFRVRIRREHDSDERFTRREHARILTHILSVRRVCEPMTLHNRWYSAVFKLEQLRTPFAFKNMTRNAYLVPEIQFAYS